MAKQLQKSQKQKPQSPTMTDDKEKIALWIDRKNLATLRALKEKIGVPVSESINRAVAAYLKNLKTH